MANVEQLAIECPVCTQGALEPTEQQLDLMEVLARWETEASIRFDEAVWQHYRDRDPSTVTLHRCTECAVGFFLPMRPGSDQFYDDITATEYYLEDKWEFRRAADDLAPLGPTRLLDIGCGRGDFLDLARRGDVAAECIGFEFGNNAAAEARRRGLTVHTGAFPDAITDAGDTPFDAITLFQVLEHVEDPMAMLDGIGGLLAPGGALVITVPDAEGPVRYYQDALTDIPPHHVTRWTARAFEACLPRCGFDITRITHDPLPPYLWEAYLPKLWDEPLWPSRLCRAAEYFRRLGPAARTQWFIRWANQLNLKRLPGVRGLSLYVLARRRDA